MSKKTTPGKNRVRVNKQDRSGRRCPACGGIQPGAAARTERKKPTGRDARNAKQSVDTVTPVAMADSASPHFPESVDAVTLIKGVVQGVSTSLAESADPQLTTSSLTAAVRKAVLDEFRTRAQFAGRIAEIDALLWTRTPDRKENPMMPAMNEHLRDLGIRRLDIPQEDEAFVVTEGDGTAFELLRPAYIDEMTGKVILSGQLRRVPVTAGEQSTGEEA